MESGETLTYTVTVNNLGPLDAENVVVTDTLPPGVTFISTFGCTDDPAGVPTCSLGTLAAGGSATFNITVDVDFITTGVITNQATVSSDTDDPNSGNDNASLDTLVIPGPFADLSVAKSTTTTLLAGIRPDDIRVNPITNRIYINDFNGGSVLVLDGSTNTLIATVPVGSQPEDVVVNRITNRVYVNNRLSNNVSVIDGGTNAVIATIPVGTFPDDVRLDEATNRVYVNNRDSDTMSIIDGSTNTVIATIPVGDRPSDFQLNRITNKIYVANESSNDVTVIDGATNTVITTLPVGAGPRVPQVNTSTNRIYVRSSADDTITVIDGSSDTVIATVGVGDFPDDVRINADTNRIYVANRSGNTVSVIDGATNLVVATVPVGLRPDRMRVDQVTNKIYTLNRNSDSVSIIDGATNLVLATPSVGDFPQEVRINPTTHRVYVVNRNSNDVSVIDGTTDAVVDTIPVGFAPRDIGINPVTGSSYVTSFPVGAISVLRDTVNAGDTLTYSVTVSNFGPADAENVVVTDALPSGVTFVSTSGCGEDPAGVPTCSLGTVAAGSSATFTITVDIDSGTLGVVINQATVSSDTDDPDAANNNASLDTLVIPATIQVDIDIKPGSDPNSINLKSKGVIPVAILGSAAFDVSDVDVTNLAFGPGGAAPDHTEGGHLEDVNGDGFTDLVSHYRTQETGIAKGDTEACVNGLTTGGVAITGCDSVKIAGK